MDAVKLALAAALVIAPAGIRAHPGKDPVLQWRPIAAEASARFGIPVDWIERVIRAESGGLAILGGKPIRSRAGAMGLMQLMPATWAAMRDAHRLGANPDDPHDNIIAGTAFLASMRDRFGYPGLFAAYSAGPLHYAAYLAGRSRLQDETIAYVARLAGTRSAAAVTAAAPSRRLLFVLRHNRPEQEQSASEPTASGGLFAIRKGLP